MKSGGFKASLNGSDSDDFPPMPNAGQGEGISFKASALKDALRQVVYAASTDDSRPVLNGVLFEMEGSNLTLAATDGFRLTDSSEARNRPAGSESEQTDLAVRCSEGTGPHYTGN